jgi:hypothetical protein
MRLPDLQRILVDGARRQEQAATHPVRARARGRRALMVLVAVLLVGGGAAGAVITLSRSEPLSGTLARGPSGSGPSRYRISVVPYMTVGWSGWCTSAVFNGRGGREETDFGCVAVESGGPELSGRNEFGSGMSEYTDGVVSNRVATIRWDGKTVAPIASPNLPRGTRAYFIVGHPPSGGRFPRLPRLFDAAGREIVEPPITRQAAVEHLPEIAVNPRNPGTSPCAVRASALSHLVPLGETVTTPVPWPRHQPGAFLACANATYKLDRTTLSVAVLVDATNARRLAPALPELQRDSAHPGLLTGQELGNIGSNQGFGALIVGGGRAFDIPRKHTQQPASNDISARRSGFAWIIAEGGTPDQRATLLAHLSTRA